eukprot:COSAG06_NODE_4291_length_4394_cov_1.783236_8_plen_100_part_00
MLLGRSWAARSSDGEAFEAIEEELGSAKWLESVGPRGRRTASPLLLLPTQQPANQHGRMMSSLLVAALVGAVEAQDGSSQCSANYLAQVRASRNHFSLP